jgi:hypothetical protein
MKRRSAPKNEIWVYYQDGSPDPQPETFRLCPLGVQFFSRNRLPEYQQIEVSLSGAAGAMLPKPARCEGVVVHCQYDRHRRLYRNWILFLNLPDDIRCRFRCLAKESGWLCPHCENF